MLMEVIIYLKANIKLSSNSKVVIDKLDIIFSATAKGLSDSLLLQRGTEYTTQVDFSVI